MKNQRWIPFASIGFCLSIALALGFAPSASAQEDSDQRPSDNPQCMAENLQGRYGYTVSGWLVGLVPVAEVGIVTFDGEGIILNAQDTVNSGGAITRRTAGVGTYGVNPNCTGSATVAGDFAGLTFDFMIIPGTNGSGAGILSGHDTVSNNGSIVPRDVTSTYAVNSDCTGTQEWTDGSTFDWVIVAGGTQVFFIRTDHPNTRIASGTYKKQSGSDAED